MRGSRSCVSLMGDSPGHIMIGEARRVDLSTHWAESPLHGARDCLQVMSLVGLPFELRFPLRSGSDPLVRGDGALHAYDGIHANKAGPSTRLRSGFGQENIRDRPFSAETVDVLPQASP
jgi:hypothetical protein